jgi:hypothetical protein
VTGDLPPDAFLAGILAFVDAWSPEGRFYEMVQLVIDLPAQVQTYQAVYDSLGALSEQIMPFSRGHFADVLLPGLVARMNDRMFDDLANRLWLFEQMFDDGGLDLGATTHASRYAFLLEDD